MKICVMGYSGAGKSTLAKKLAQRYKTDVLYLDTVHWLPNWEIRSQEEKARIVGEFLDSHESWVIDGNYTKLYYERRLKEADEIVLLRLGRWRCLGRVIRRYRRYRGTTRPDLGEGCPEKLDWEFARWVLWDGRKRRARERLRRIREKYPEKTIVLKSQRQIDAFERDRGLPGSK